MTVLTKPVSWVQPNLAKILGWLADGTYDGVYVTDRGQVMAALVSAARWQARQWMVDRMTVEKELSLRQVLGTQSAWVENGLYVLARTIHLLDQEKKYLPVLGPSAYSQGVINSGAANGDVQYTAQMPGQAGDNITVEHVDPGAASQPLTISTTVTNTGATITVSLETDAGGNVVSTAAQVAQAVNADETAGALVYAQEEGDGSGVVGLGSATLSGGQTLNVHATAVLDSAAANSDVTVSILQPDGNLWTVEFVDPGQANASLSYETDMSDKKLIVRLATDGGGAVTTTAADVVNNWPTGWTDSFAVAAYEGDGSGVVDAQAVQASGGSTHPDEAKWMVAKIVDEGQPVAYFVRPEIGNLLLL